MPEDAKAGARAGRFPTTRRSAVAGVRSADAAERARSFEALAASYWKPVYKYVRVRWGKGSEEAQDLTQGFFLRVMEKDFFAAYDPDKGRFRTFLRVCLEGYLANEARAAGRRKRGGEAVFLPLDVAGAEAELTATGTPAADPDRYFGAEWVRSLFGLAVEALRRECASKGKEVCFRIFERYDLEEDPSARPTYEDLAAGLGIPATTVTNHLAWARREFRRLVLEALREATASDEEFRREARDLLGMDPP